MSVPMELHTGDMDTQHEWHEAYRDMMTNMYRTSYQDMVHGREVSVRKDLPAGYGGHIPSLRHDILFRNTAFDHKQATLRSNFGRDVFPSFSEQLSGVPSHTEYPRGKRKPETAGTIPDTRVKPPWALTMNIREPPTSRAQVGKMTDALQAPLPTARERRNTSALRAAHSLTANETMPPKSGVSSARYAVAKANEESVRQRMPTETEILRASQSSDNRMHAW